jgi:hypothetical protein
MRLVNRFSIVLILLVFTRRRAGLSLGAGQFLYALGFTCWSGLRKAGKRRLAAGYRTFFCMGLAYIYGPKSQVDSSLFNVRFDQVVEYIILSSLY